MGEVFCSDKPDVLADKLDSLEGTREAKKVDEVFDCSALADDNEQYSWALKNRRKSLENEKLKAQHNHFRG